MEQGPGGYWSLYLDFVDAMGRLRVCGIPLALVGNFNRYVSDDLRRRIEAGTGGGSRFAVLPTEGQPAPSGIRTIQPAFDERIRAQLVPAASRARGRHVAICTSLLRFPESVYYEYFRPEKAVIVADGTGSGGSGARHGLPIHHLQAYGENWARTAKAAIRLADKLFRRAASHPLLVDGALRERFLADIPEMVRLVVQAERYMEQHPPGCLLLGTTELMLTRVLALAARRRAIPVICLQHGVIALEESYMPVFADVQGVYGPADMDWYAERGVGRHRLALTGHPRFDPIFTATPKPERTAAAKLGVPPDEWRVLVATQPHLPAEQIGRLVSLLAQKPGLRVLIKPHPLEERTEKMTEYARMAGDHRNVTLIPRRIGLYDVLPHAGCAIAESSTVGLEALMAGSPLLVLRGPYSAIFERQGVPAGDPEQLAEWAFALMERRMRDTAGMEALQSLYPLRLSAPELAALIRRTSGIDCRPRVSWLRDGMLLKGEGPAVYLIQGGMRRHIAGPMQLKVLMKITGEKVRLVKPEILKRIPLGEPL
jgi:hypothetical protein